MMSLWILCDTLSQQRQHKSLDKKKVNEISSLAGSVKNSKFTRIRTELRRKIHTATERSKPASTENVEYMRYIRWSVYKISWSSANRVFVNIWFLDFFFFSREYFRYICFVFANEGRKILYFRYCSIEACFSLLADIENAMTMTIEKQKTHFRRGELSNFHYFIYLHSMSDLINRICAL